MSKLGFITEDALARAIEEPLDLQRPQHPFNAPHFVSYLREHYFGESPPAVIESTLDLALQNEVEKIVDETVALYKSQGLNQAAVVVMSMPRRGNFSLGWVK